MVLRELRNAGCGDNASSDVIWLVVPSRSSRVVGQTAACWVPGVCTRMQGNVWCVFVVHVFVDPVGARVFTTTSGSCTSTTTARTCPCCCCLKSSACGVVDDVACTLAFVSNNRVLVTIPQQQSCLLHGTHSIDTHSIDTHSISTYSVAHRHLLGGAAGVPAGEETKIKHDRCSLLTHEFGICLHSDHFHAQHYNITKHMHDTAADETKRHHLD